MRVNATLAVLAVNVLAAVVLAELWSDPARFRWTEPQPQVPAIDQLAAEPAGEAADISAYRETLERPIFASTRRSAPRKEAGAVVDDESESLRDVRLLGTYGAGNRGGVIVLRAGKVERVPVGASIGGWQVAGEDGRGAALVRGSGERRRLDLALSTTAPAAAKPPAEGRPAAAGDVPAAAAAGQQKADASGARASATNRGWAVRSGRVDASRQRKPMTEEEQQERLRQIEERKRERMERLNSRRAEKGLPPLSAPQQ